MSRPAHTLPMSVLAVALVASLVYAAAPAPPPSLRAAWTHGATATWDEPAARERAPHGGAPEALPRRLARAVLPLTVKRIVLDAGHGGVHTGAVSDSGLTEKELTLDIALRLGRLLRASTAFEVLLTRDTDTTLSLQQRAAFANAARADLFVSVHVNWIPHRGIRPVETYFVGPSDDPAVLRLASLENRESGYTLAAYRHLLERVYLHARRDESQALARQVNAELFRTLAEVNPALRNWGVKTAPFAVLVGTEMPAVLVEVSCLSNEEEVDLLTTADYRDRIAAALLRGIRSYANELERVGRNEG